MSDDLPRYPEASAGEASPGHRPAPNRAWWQYALASVLVAMLVLMVGLHLAGVLGPGSH